MGATLARRRWPRRRVRSGYELGATAGRPSPDGSCVTGSRPAAEVLNGGPPGLDRPAWPDRLDQAESAACKRRLLLLGKRAERGPAAARQGKRSRLAGAAAAAAVPRAGGWSWTLLMDRGGPLLLAAEPGALVRR